MSGPKPASTSESIAVARLLEDREVGAARLDALTGGGRDRSQLLLGGGELVGRLRPTMATSQPRAAYSLAVASPIPLLPPVTMTVTRSLMLAPRSTRVADRSIRLAVESSGCAGTVSGQRSAAASAVTAAAISPPSKQAAKQGARKVTANVVARQQRDALLGGERVHGKRRRCRDHGDDGTVLEQRGREGRGIRLPRR